jgi:uncharacterized protein
MLQHIPIISEYDKGNGICRYLENNLCGIYENRPLICNTEKMYRSYFRETMTENEFVTMNMAACIQIAEHFNDESVKKEMIELYNHVKTKQNKPIDFLKKEIEFRSRELPPLPGISAGIMAHKMKEVEKKIPVT